MMKLWRRIWQSDQNNTYATLTFHFEQGILLLSAYIYFCFSSVLK
jgi:hypothetical protein